ncbi:MAG TPA: hypothetical protein VER32_14470 [Pyrinomonadaceae bacterium]|nr:hypothetical protein [Pyrinomonadaceae bacterium]
MRAPADDTGMVERAVDPRIKYPCYKSLDEFVDVERLKSLDGYITERIRRRLRAQADALFMNSFRLEASTPETPGQRMIYLTQSLQAFNYYDLDHPELWRATEAAREFSPLMDFIATLPFKATGRMLIMYDDTGTAVPAHRDHLDADVCHQFVWFRTNLTKPFYVLNHRTGEKRYVESYSAWFDTVNQFHGSDAREGLSFSIRVDGVFTDDFLRRVPAPASNAASTPALWACLSD